MLGHSLYDGCPLKELDGLLTELGVDVVRSQPLYHRDVGWVVSVRLKVKAQAAT